MGNTPSRIIEMAKSTMAYGNPAKVSCSQRKIGKRAKKGINGHRRETVYRLPANLKICDSFDSAYWTWMRSDEAEAEFYGDAAEVDSCPLPTPDLPPSSSAHTLQKTWSTAPMEDSCDYDEMGIFFGLAEISQGFNDDEYVMERKTMMEARDSRRRGLSPLRYAHGYDSDDERDTGVLVNRHIDVYADAGENESGVVSFFMLADATVPLVDEVCAEVAVEQDDEPWVVDPGLDATSAQDWFNGGWDNQVSSAWLAAGGCEVPWSWVTRSWNEY